MSSLTTAGSSMEEEEFHTRLSLEIGEKTSHRSPPQKTTTVRLFGELISPPPPQDQHGDHHREPRAPVMVGRKHKRVESGGVVTAAVHGGGGRNNSKKVRMTLLQAEDDDGGDRRSPSDGGSSRKKLRLTGAQATMLEDSFRAHNILSHGQKQELARRVGLSARQVEVWFQNRRARTKLKQTEVDCELLRRWCDRLTDENARLRRDLAELRAVSVVCPSCCDKKTTMPVVAGSNVA
ncbi:hypothetical protein PR202_gb06233 [Eleusine coracana subsp. coracana]|uniref:Homeobox domain-containing protein n=1 Tax=Eleusine coracana subsp. coracana TaxID=191504 RepID=A0AAV5E9Y4_ELECO|nr:hypothetical protein QOZ80_2BG0155050 [Eleusine coracana subsp. coracana]GJN19006.1 hypothetical protein PR202_gb06233 [Eleusine coracana subsp. coracana]